MSSCRAMSGCPRSMLFLLSSLPLPGPVNQSVSHYSINHTDVTTHCVIIDSRTCWCSVRSICFLLITDQLFMCVWCCRCQCDSVVRLVFPQHTEMNWKKNPRYQCSVWAVSALLSFLWLCLCWRRLTGLLLLVVGELLDGAAVAEAADRTGQPFPQSVSRAFGTRRAGLQRAERRLRLQVGHWLGLPIRAAHRVIFWKESGRNSHFNKKPLRLVWQLLFPWSYTPIKASLFCFPELSDLCIKFFIVFGR